jgi:hypothetical protein
MSEIDPKNEMIPSRFEHDETKLAEEPTEWRILRAYSNGFRDGLHRGASATPFDHS